MSKNEGWTMSVPEAGQRYFDIGRDASYAAAKAGIIPTIRVGKLLRVPIRVMERQLDQVGSGQTMPAPASPKSARRQAQTGAPTPKLTPSAV